MGAEDIRRDEAEAGAALQAALTVHALAVWLSTDRIPSPAELLGG